MIDASKPLRILVVEDNDTHAKLLENAVTDTLALGMEAVRASTLAEAVAHVAEQGADAALLDLSLPDSTGPDTLRTFKDKAPHIPIVALTGAGDEWTGNQTLVMGAMDFLPKERINPELLARSLVYAMERHRLTERLERMCLTDVLTGTLNRNGFLDLAGKQLAMAERENRRAFLVCADVDQLREVNARFGHDVGDMVIRKAVELLQTTFRQADVIGRLSGDEFGVFGMEQSPSEYGRILERLEQAVAEMNASKALPAPLGLTCGLAYSHPQDPRTLSDMLNEAETIMQEKMAQA